MVITSFRLSAAVASRVSEWIFWPRLWLKADIQNFTRIETPRTRAGTRPKRMAWGWKIFSRELLPSSTPMTRIRADTASPARYSYRA